MNMNFGEHDSGFGRLDRKPLKLRELISGFTYKAII